MSQINNLIFHLKKVAEKSEAKLNPKEIERRRNEEWRRNSPNWNIENNNINAGNIMFFESLRNIRNFCNISGSRKNTPSSYNWKRFFKDQLKKWDTRYIT